MIDRAEVARSGAALRVWRDGGDPVVVRQKDLSDVLGEFRSGGQRLSAVTAAGHVLELEYADGTSESLSEAMLFPDRDPARVETLVEGASMVMTCDGPGLGLVRDGVVCIGGGRVRWVGPRTDLPASLDVSHAYRVDAGGRLVTPGLVDPHAHPLFAGKRAEEFAMRAAGRGYLDIQAAGGGINATVVPTRNADLASHVALTTARVARAFACGTTTMEAKSGYALTVDGELELLEAALVVDAVHPVDLVPTLLGAHLVPSDRANDRDGYIADVTDHMIPAAAARRLCTSVDVYCDDNAFTLAETERVLRAAKAAGLAVRAHAGQFADLGAPQLLAELGGLSADHLEQVSADGMAAMARANVVATMLPGACVQLKMTPPPVDALRAAGVAMAIGTDLNPGSSNTESLPVQMWLATTHYGMTVDEAWLGVTSTAARAVGRTDIGRLAAGAAGDVVVWDAETPADVPYHYGVNLAHTVIKAGRPYRSHH